MSYRARVLLEQAGCLAWLALGVLWFSTLEEAPASDEVLWTAGVIGIAVGAFVAVWLLHRRPDRASVWFRLALAAVVFVVATIVVTLAGFATGVAGAVGWGYAGGFPLVYAPRYVSLPPPKSSISRSPRKAF